MKYYFSHKKVCKYLDINATHKDFKFSDAPSVALFGENNTIVKNLNIYKQIHNEICTLKNIHIKNKLGEGVYGKVFSVCLNEKKCDIKYAFKIVKLDGSDDSFIMFWNEVLTQMQMSFTGYSPNIIASWTCKKGRGFMGYIIMEKIEPDQSKMKSQDLLNLYATLNGIKMSHNDTNVGNIISTKNGIKLIDFGLAVQFKQNNTVYPRFNNTFSIETYPGKKYVENWDYYMTELNHIYYTKNKFIDKDMNTDKMIDFINKYSAVLNRRGLSETISHYFDINI